MPNSAFRIKNVYGLAARLFRVWTSGSLADISTSPAIRSGSGAAIVSENNGSLWLRTDGPPEYRSGGAWVALGWLADSSMDRALTVTSADQLLNADLSVNHATAVGIAVDAQAIQLTTARTSGNLIAFSGATTSLAGDSGGNYIDFMANTPTDGGGSATHIAFKVAAGHDIAWDLSAAATGESDVVLGDNLASAFEIRESTNTYLKVVTTNGSESVAAEQRLTTTDGVASGTARKIGGQAFASTSTTDAVTAAASNNAHVDFAQTYSVPANTIKAGTHLKVRAMVRVTDASGTDTLEVKLYLGGTTLITSTAFDPDAAADFVIAEFDLWGHATPGAAAAVDGYGHWVTSDGGVLARGEAILAPTNHATDGALVIKASAKWSSNTASTSATLEVLDVEAIS